jgi:uncharacterized FlgJ-related protein
MASNLSKSDQRSSVKKSQQEIGMGSSKLAKESNNSEIMEKISNL